MNHHTNRGLNREEGRHMRVLRKMVPTSPRRIFGALILAPMLYAGAALVATTPARAAEASNEICTLNSTSMDESSCFKNSSGQVCCTVCDNYVCLDGTTFSKCRRQCSGNPVT